MTNGLFVEDLPRESGPPAARAERRWGTGATTTYSEQKGADGGHVVLSCPSERTEIAADRPLIGDPETFALVIRPITGG